MWPSLAKVANSHLPNCAYAEAYEAGGGSPDAKEVRVSFAPAPAAMATEAAPAPAMADALANARPRSPETEMNPLAA